VIKAERAQT